jgi:hypothetical protein
MFMAERMKSENGNQGLIAGAIPLIGRKGLICPIHPMR